MARRKKGEEPEQEHFKGQEPPERLGADADGELAYDDGCGEHGQECDEILRISDVETEPGRHEAKIETKDAEHRGGPEENHANKPSVFPMPLKREHAGCTITTQH